MRDLAVSAALAALFAWERRYNTYRPHRALGYLTPNEFHSQWVRTHHGKEAVSDMS